MCGIATIAIGRKSRGRIPYSSLRRLTSEILVELQNRGVDASGIAVINEPGTEESWVFKKPLRSDRLINRAKFDETIQKIGPNTNFILLHSRATTVGDTSDNFNNHPIIIPNFIGIHNGTLHNDDALFDEFKGQFPREGKVDSEIIFRLFAHYTEQGCGPREAIQKTSAHLSGAFTGAVIDWRHAHRMVMFKNERSLCLITVPHFDMVIAVSEALFYQRAISRLGIKAKATSSYVYDKVGLVIDLNTGRKAVESVEDFTLPIQGSETIRHSSWVSAYAGY